jgi:hypothetical protein
VEKTGFGAIKKDNLDDWDLGSDKRGKNKDCNRMRMRMRRFLTLTDAFAMLHKMFFGGKYTYLV